MFRTAIAALVFLSAASVTASAETTIRVGGTGASVEALKRLGEAFASTETGYRLEVIPGLGSTGAIAAVADGALDFAVSGRALKREEHAKGLTERALMRTPFALVTSAPDPQSLPSADAAEFFAGQRSQWKDGTPVRVILRPKSESDTVVLGNMFPGMAAAIEQVRTRPDVPVAGTDQDNADNAEKIPGSLAAATYTQVRAEQRKLNFVPIDGVNPTIENFAAGAYPYGKLLTFVFPATRSAGVEGFIVFLGTPEGIRAMRDTGNLPVAQ